MDQLRQNVQSAEVAWLRAIQDVRQLEREHNAALSPLLQRAAQLETAYFEAKDALHAELDARGR